MKIKEIIIRNYGPIVDLCLNPMNFELIFGLNETGKTAIVEALSSVLFKKDQRRLRYGKPREITIKIEKDGRNYDLPEKRLSIELPVGDVSNILYVQASKSSIYEEEARFWDGIKTMLSRVGEGIPFVKLSERIFDAVELQPKKAEWKGEKQVRIQGEIRRRDELAEYLKKFGEIEKKESELVSLLAKKERLNHNLAEIADYKKSKNYQQLVNLYNAYQEKKTNLQGYERYKDEYLTKWQELVIAKRLRLNQEKQLARTKEEIKDLEGEIAELKRKNEIIETQGFKTILSEISKKVVELPISYQILTLTASAIVLILALFSFIPKLPTFIILIILFALSGFFGYKRSQAKNLLKRRGFWLTKAKGLFSDIKDLDELGARIELLQKTLLTKETSLSEKKKNIEHSLDGETATEIEKKISNLREMTGLAELTDLQKKIATKKKLEGEKNVLNGKLSGMLYEKDEARWQSLITEKRVSPPATEPDLTREAEIAGELAVTEEKVEVWNREIRVFKEVAKAKLGITDDRSVFIEFDKLEKAIQSYELEKDAALAAQKILNKMSGELDEFIQDIIVGEESLSEYFNLITGCYDKVEVEDKNFVVVDKSGKKFKIEDLSSGAQDQLLLCFRLAALKRIYPEGSFIILDDAFIFADWPRRQRLGKLLKKFIGDGNQVIYLTSDDHTRDLLQKFGARVTAI